ncbi:hypothetical protein N7540_004174 [Penicillium herquei]|nr:hypothetical protein N7540_004174 [Penicillium herquei]
MCLNQRVLIARSLGHCRANFRVSDSNDLLNPAHPRASLQGYDRQETLLLPYRNGYSEPSYGLMRPSMKNIRNDAYA